MYEVRKSKLDVRKTLMVTTYLYECYFVNVALPIMDAEGSTKHWKMFPTWT